MTMRIGRLFRSRARFFTGVLAAVTVTGAGLASVVPVAASAAPVPVHRRVAPLVSPKVHRPGPKVPAAGGYSDGLSRRPPKMVSEIVRDRTATSSTWRDADGSITVRRYLTPQFYRPSREAGWQPIVTRLSPAAGKAGWWESRANSWRVRFGRAGAEQVRANGADVGFTPEGPGSRGLLPSVSGSLAAYKDLWPHASLTELATSTGVAEDLVLSSRAAASRYTFGLSGATARPVRSGGLDLVSGGRLVGVVPPLSVATAQPAGAAAGRRSGSARLIPGAALWRRPVADGAEARLSVTGGRVVVSVSRSWLTSLPASAFPVVIDPSFTVNQAYGSQVEQCVSSTGACSAAPFVTVSNSLDAAAWVPFPQPPTTQGAQPWVPTYAQFQAECANGAGALDSCALRNDAVYGDSIYQSSPPASYNAVFGGTALYVNSGGEDAAFNASITSWINPDALGAWFGLAGTVASGGPDFFPATIWVGFTYYQEPAASALLSPLPGSVQATTTPALTSNHVDSNACGTTNEPPVSEDGGSYACDQPSSILYDFQVSTSPTWGAGQVVADSGWVTQSYTVGTTCTDGQCPITYHDTTWTVPAGALTDGMTYYVTVQDADTSQNPLQNSAPLVPPAIPKPAISFTVKLRLGDGGPSPTDTVGAPPGQTSVPSQGAPSPGLSPASETVNMVTGDLALAVGTPSMTTLAGPAGLTLTYNSLQSSTMTGSQYGLTASFYPDSGSHQFPAPGGTTPPLAGSLVEPQIDMTNDANPPVGGILPDAAWLGSWKGTITIPSGSWELGGLINGGMRIYVDGTLVYNDWSGTASTKAPSFGSATATGAHQIEVDAWQPYNEDTATVQLYAQNTGVNPAQENIVPSSWLSPQPTGLPPGWSLGATGPAWTSATDTGTQVVLQSPTGATAAFTRNSDGTYTPQPGDTDSLTEVNGAVQLSASDGYLYQFNTAGQLTSMTSVADVRHPADLVYSYTAEPAGDPVVLTSIKDPVSDRSITLSYGTGCGSDGNNAGLLCQITYFDGASTIFTYNGNDQLDQVQSLDSSGNPTQNITQFGYDSDGRLDDIRDALAYNVLADAVPGEPACTSGLSQSCVLDTWITYNTGGQAATVTQPQPAPGQARPERTYTYNPATPLTQGTTQVAIAGFNPAGASCSPGPPGCMAVPAGVDEIVSYDSQSRIISQTSSTGLTSYTTWDSQDRPIITVSPDGEQTSTVYDTDSDVTDTYGPAPTACFDPSTIPAGITLSGTATGYLALTNASTTPGCMVKVPWTQNGYDEGITGLADTYWSNGQHDGAPSQYGTGNGDTTSGGLPTTPCTGYGIQIGTNSAADLCDTWPAGTPPNGVTPDSNNQWSLQMNGDISLTSSGDWIFCIADTQQFTMTIDSALVLTNIEYELYGGDPNNDFQGTYAGTAATNCEDATLTAGEHTIQITMQGSPAQATSYNVGVLPPGSSSIMGLPLTWLDPAYGLRTSTTDPDGDVTDYSYNDPSDHITPTFGLVTATTQDPSGLDLTTATSYQDPTEGGYLQKTATTLPAGNQTTYTYYTGTSGPIASGSAACLNGGTPDQGGQLEQLAGPAPGGNGQSRIQQYVYDADGRPLGERVGDANDINTQPWQCTSYDTIGRITSQNWPASNGSPARTVTYSYNVGGNPLVSSVSDPTGTITATEDLLGRVTSYTDALGQTTTTTYNQAGQTTATDGPGGSLTFGYDSNSGQPTTTTVNGTQLADASYNSIGQMTSVTYGNGTQAAIGYNTDGNQDSLSYTNTSTGQPITADSVTYTPAGRWAAETASQGTGTLDIAYGYDNAGRLTSAADTIAGTTTTNSYSYAASPGCNATGDDPDAGENTNITSVTTKTGSTTTATTSYCYNIADQLVSSNINGTASTSYAYSEDGDQTNDNGTTYTWDASDRVATATTPGGTEITSTYDALNRLIESSASGGSTALYSYGGYSDTPVAVLNTSNDVVQSIIPLPGGATDIVQSSGNVWDYSNLQGDTTATSNNGGTLTSGPVTYNPWGVLNPGVTAPANTTGPSSLGAYATGGKLTNAATGTILLGARTFNPAEARFLSVDPVQGGCANPYTYAFGDPLNKPDLSGDIAGCESFGDSGSLGYLEAQINPATRTLQWGLRLSHQLQERMPIVSVSALIWVDGQLHTYSPHINSSNGFFHASYSTPAQPGAIVTFSFLVEDVYGLNSNQAGFAICIVG